MSFVNSESVINKIFFGQYKVNSLIGEGSFGKCYKGINTKINEEICLKIENKNSKKAFLQFESYVLEKLKGGKGIPEFYLYGYSDDYNILIMELLDHTLGDVFQRNNRKININVICIITIQIVSILKNYFYKNILYS